MTPAATQTPAATRRTATLGRTPTGQRIPKAAHRAVPLIDGLDPKRGWVVTLAVTALAFVLRVWDLGRPKTLLFDETYYAKDAWSMLQFGYVRTTVEGADKQIVEGQTTGLFQDSPAMIVHPELGKWLIALGEQAFGMNSFGWRISSAVVGSLMVLVMVRLARRVTGSTLLGGIAGLLLALDGLALVLSRLALLDIFVAFFMLSAVSCLVADRDWVRRRMARVVREGPVAVGSWGPRVWWRPWLLASGVLWGLALGSKWTAAYALAAFGLLVWAWGAGARRSFGVRGAWWKAALLDALPAFFYLVVLGLMVYVATWTGWLLNAAEYERTLSDTQYGPYWGTYLEKDARGFLPELLQSLRSLWNYHHDVFAFHTRFLNDAKHTYESKPWGWLLLNRPVGVDAQLDIAPGEQGCRAAPGSTCLRQVLLLGTPAIWWAAVPALVWVAVRWVVRRDWRCGLVLVGVAATWLPWFRYDDRPIFSFYAIAILPFTILALTMAIGAILGPADAAPARRRTGAWVVGAYLFVVVLNAGWFWPIWTDQLITHGQWLQRIWFDHWI